MNIITEEEKKVVEELKSRTINDVTPKTLEDISLFYRFAKARDFNLAEAEVMLRKHIIWRKEMEIDSILTDYKPPEVLLKYVPSSFVCLDKAGCAVRTFDGGRTDSRGLGNVTKIKEFAKFCAFYLEKDKGIVIKQSPNELGKKIFHPIYDFDGLTYANAANIKTLQNSVYIIRMFLDNYPESIRIIRVINAPFYFTWVYAAVKPVLPPVVIEKLKIYGREGWKEALLEDIDANDLPAYLGGNRTDPDGNPLCETFIVRGKPIPKSYYMQNITRTLAFESGVEKCSVGPFSKKEITFEVKHENSYLEWEFQTKNRDIDFSLHFRRKSFEDVECVELIPKQRIDTCYEPEKGCYKCEKSGNYIIVFDNSYSWLHSKEVYFRIGIKKLKDNEFYKPT